MELRALAELVLRSDRLEDKLAGSDDLSDRHPGPAWAGPPDAPGRPRSLRMDDGRPRARFPTEGSLHRPEARATALHFFANHELLAAELMALCLLRFPEAPAAFRMGVARTLREEQRHLGQYIQRMQALGLGLGEVPLNGTFWRVLAPMKTPLHYVSGMSLVFEQANLDHAAAWMNRFRGADDPVSADLMAQVLEDEIGHVRHGVTWFERWRPKGADAFAAFGEALPPGLDPIRAKGSEMVEQPRLRAGLSPAFVAALRAHRGSKGRRPRVYVFRPDVEDTLAGRSQPDGVLAELIDDLSPVFGLLGGDDDLVLTERPGCPTHRAQLQALGLSSPNPVRPEALAETGPDQLVPWGSAPEIRRGLEQLSAVCRVPLTPPADEAARLDKLSVLTPRAEAAAAGWLPAPWVGVPLTDPEALPPPPVLLKARRSAAGRHRRRIEAAPSKGDLRFLRGALAEGPVLAEPWLQRHLDLGLVLPPTGRPQLLRFFTDDKGAYRGHWLGHPLHGVAPELAEPLVRHPAGGLEGLMHAVARRVRALFPAGPLGVDWMVASDGAQRAVQPWVEINGRWTMGHVAARLARRHLAPGSVGLWWHLRGSDLRRLGFEDFAELGPRLEAHAMRTVQLGRRLGLVAGAVPTNPPSSARRVLSVLVVDEDAAALEARFESLFHGLRFPLLSGR